MQADRDVAHGLRDLDRHDLVDRRGLGVAEIGRAEEPHRASGQASNSRWVALSSSVTSFGQLAEIGMGEGVIADLVTLGEHALHEIRIGLRVRRR